MAQFLANCPRCGAKKTTFDLKNSLVVGVEHGWLHTFEGAAVCRECNRHTVFWLRQNSSNTDTDFFRGKSPESFNGSISEFVDVKDYMKVSDMAASPPPDHLPDEVKNVYVEASKCYSIGCWNAAGAMFRAALDKATKSMMPKEDVEGLNNKIRNTLGLRLPWLFETKRLPDALRELSTCIKDDGNDGVHDANLTESDAADLADFAFILLERIYTEPKRLQIAAERRSQRRSLS